MYRLQFSSGKLYATKVNIFYVIIKNEYKQQAPYKSIDRGKYIENIQIFLLNMSFFTSDIKDIFYKKHLNFLFYYLQISHSLFKVKRSESYFTLAFVLIF